MEKKFLFYLAKVLTSPIKANKPKDTLKYHMELSRALNEATHTKKVLNPTLKAAELKKEHNIDLDRTEVGPFYHIIEKQSMTERDAVTAYKEGFMVFVRNVPCLDFGRNKNWFMLAFLAGFSVTMTGIAYLIVQQLQDSILTIRSLPIAETIYTLCSLILLAFWMKFACAFILWKINKRELMKKYADQ